jgi:hypothetical protein
MYGLIVKLTAAGGKRDELIAILKGSAVDPGASATLWPRTPLIRT